LGSLEVFPVKYVLGLVGICGFLKFLTWAIFPKI
jgi:hypothetical protein